MYKVNSQLRIEDFVFPYGKLDPENDWVKLAALVPWIVVKERYAAQFSNNEHPAHPARMALGALLIQRRLKCSDGWLVKHVGENPYLQFFVGMKVFDSRTHSIPRRIISLAQPWICPIVQGKAHADTEFGAKLHVSLVNGYARIERLDFESYNESEDVWKAIARYRERYGCCPEPILADKIYRNQQTLAFCKEQGIRLFGPTLGKPPKDQNLSRLAKKQEYQDSCDRNAVRGVFGTGKTAYGLARVMACLPETACCVIKEHISLAKQLPNLLEQPVNDNHRIAAYHIAGPPKHSVCADDNQILSRRQRRFLLCPTVIGLVGILNHFQRVALLALLQTDGLSS